MNGEKVSWAPKSLWKVTAAMKFKDACFLEEKLWHLDSIFRSRGLTLLDKSPYSECYDFSSSHVQMWELDHKESWVTENWCFQTVVLEKTLENPLESKEIEQVNSKGDQPWIFTGRTDAKAETSISWLPDAKSWLTGNDPDAVKDWGQEEKGTAEDEMVGWHHRLDGHGFEQAQGDSEGQEAWHVAVHGVTKS